MQYHLKHAPYAKNKKNQGESWGQWLNFTCGGAKEGSSHRYGTPACSREADAARALFGNVEELHGPRDPEKERALIWKIDKTVLPLSAKSLPPTQIRHGLKYQKIKQERTKKKEKKANQILPTPKVWRSATGIAASALM